MKFARSPLALALALAPSAAPGAAARPSLREAAGGGGRRLAADARIFDTVADGAARGTGDRAGMDCSTDVRTVAFVADAGGDYLDVSTTAWHSGGYRMDCVDRGAHTGWQCAATCGPFPNPDFMDWGYLAFEAKATGAFDAACKPSVGLTKRWPMHPSNVIALEGGYVDGGELNWSEWRAVVIPIGDFATAEWPDVDGVKDISFRNCGTDYPVNPRYHVRGLVLTDSPPSISGGDPTHPPADPPTDPPTDPPSTPSPTDSRGPTASPIVPHWVIWEDAGHSHTPEDAAATCIEQEGRLGVTATEGSPSYLSISPDAWVSGGIRFGCQGRDDHYNCVKSCFPFDGSSPDWSAGRDYLTFLARVEGASEGCGPSVGLTGGGWPRSSSNKIFLEGGYVDAGELVPAEFRRVAIPLSDLATAEWDLDDVHGLSFHTCGRDDDGVAHPRLTYHVAELAVTNRAHDVLSVPPTGSPTPFVPDDILLATHRFVHTNWYPLFGADREPAGNAWHVASDDRWPSVSDAAPSTATIHIPAGQAVVYSGADATVYDKIIVEGSLEIAPAGADVALAAGTIVVEKGGSLDVRTDGSPHTVTIEIDGALDDSVDPEQIMLGVLALEGNLTVSGDRIPEKMAPVAAASAGSNVLELGGVDPATSFRVGGELVLPDTQEGLDVGHWQFDRNSYTDQTETCTIASISGARVTCESPLAFDHAAGSTAAYITRSITFKMADGSTDRAHILHTGEGKFEVRYARIEGFGRTTTMPLDSTVISPDASLKFHPGVARMDVVHQGTNQIARYALHAHHSLVEAHYTGNAILPNGRDGCVAHNSRVHIVDNVIVGADGTGIFLEDGTETGPVVSNYIIGTGGGSRGGDDGRFATSGGKDMAHGGFGVWARGKLALVADNRAEGHFGVAPFAFFVHPGFVEDKRVPDVPGTHPDLVGRRLGDIAPAHTDGLQLQSYGGFVDNAAVGTFRIGIDLLYFSSGPGASTGSIIKGASVKSLARGGRGMSTTHSALFTLDGVTFEGTVSGNTITGIWCNNCNNCKLKTPTKALTITNVENVRGGNC